MISMCSENPLEGRTTMTGVCVFLYGEIRGSLLNYRFGALAKPKKFSLRKRDTADCNSLGTLNCEKGVRMLDTTAGIGDCRWWHSHHLPQRRAFQVVLFLQSWKLLSGGSIPPMQSRSCGMNIFASWSSFQFEGIPALYRPGWSRPWPAAQPP